MALQAVTDVIRQMQSAYAELAEIGDLKTRQIVGNQVNELAQSLTKENKLLKRLSELDRDKMQAVVAFQQAVGIRPDPYMRLDQLAKFVTAIADKNAYVDALEGLAEQTKRLRSINQANQQLVRQALDYVNLSLDLLVGSPEDEVTYHNPGHAAAGPKRNSMFDTRA